MVFIDGSNFYHALKQCRGNARIDFTYMIQQIVGPTRVLVRTYYYNAPVNAAEVPDQYKKQQQFFASLNALDYFELKLGRLAHRPGGKMCEKGVDVRLAVDMVAFAAKNLYDVAVLISADGDFADAVQYVKDMGKHVEVAYPPPARLYHLRQVCDRFILLDDNYLRDLP
jgi:uncharacterized LabA/DUF88 family protein